jgi:hypothetical protein
VGFHAQAAWAPKQTNTKTCHVLVVVLVFVSVSWKLHAVKDELLNFNFETYHPSKHVMFQQVAWHAFRWPGSSNL